MGTRKLLIADCNEAFCLCLAEALEGYFSVSRCATGPEALQHIRRETPDILVLELMLPGLDGLMLLEQLRSDLHQPHVLIVSRIITDYVLEAANALGIFYILQKPCPIVAVKAHLLQWDHHLDTLAPPSPEVLTRKLLDTLHIRHSYKGFQCMHQGIVLQQRHHYRYLTKELYPEIARLCGCTPGNVERNIRHTLKQLWPRRDRAVWDQYFPGSKCPTTGAFLQRMAQVLEDTLE